MITVLNTRIDLESIHVQISRQEIMCVFKMRLPIRGQCTVKYTSRPLSGRKFGTICILIYSIHICTFENVRSRDSSPSVDIDAAGVHLHSSFYLTLPHQFWPWRILGGVLGLKPPPFKFKKF